MKLKKGDVLHWVGTIPDDEIIDINSKLVWTTLAMTNGNLRALYTRSMIEKRIKDGSIILNNNFNRYKLIMKD